MSRPESLVVITGTGTEVGKTWVAATLTRELVAAGATVSARKPTQSFAPGDGATDADVLAAATREDPTAVCPAHRWYEIAMAPPMAADALGRPMFTIADLVSELVWPDGTEVGLVEGVGGPRSPLAADGDTIDLTTALAPDHVVLVAHAGLGTINAVLLAVAPLDGIAPVTVVLNRYDQQDDLHRRNHVWLATHTDLDVVIDIEALTERVKQC